MSAFFENIIQSIDFAKYLENIDKRKIVLWGTSENNKFLLDMLNNNGYEVSLILDSKLDISKEENAVTDKEILGAEILKNNSKDFYVFVTHDYDEKIENYLNENNYLEEKDYYIIHKPVVAGNPAKVVREDIAWDREIINSDEIDKSIYWNLTSYIYD